MVFPALIAAGAAIGGSMIEANAASDAAGKSADLAWRNAQSDRQMQWDLAHQGIRWKVEDAQAAGIHPLFGLGAQTTSFSPTSVFSGDGGGGGWAAGLGRGLAAAGQDISRAVSAGSTSEERMGSRLQELAIQRGEIENAILASQLAKLNQSQVGPAIPSAVPNPRYSDITSAPLDPPYEVKKPEILATQPGLPAQEGGASPSVKWARTNSGGFSPFPSEAAVGDVDMENPLVWEWLIKNRIAPTIAGTQWWHPYQVQKNFREKVLGIDTSGDPRPWNPPPRSFLPRGAVGWRWDRRDQSYHPVYEGR